MTPSTGPSPFITHTAFSVAIFLHAAGAERRCPPEPAATGRRLMGRPLPPTLYRVARRRRGQSEGALRSPRAIIRRGPINQGAEGGSCCAGANRRRHPGGQWAGELPPAARRCVMAAPRAGGWRERASMRSSLRCIYFLTISSPPEAIFQYYRSLSCITS